MDPEVNILSEVSRAEKDKDHDITYMWNLKKKKKKHTNELIYKTKTDSQTYKTILWLPKGNEGEGYIKSLTLTDTYNYIYDR